MLNQYCNCNVNEQRAMFHRESFILGYRYLIPMHEIKGNQTNLLDRFIERQIKQFCNNTVGHFLVAVIEGIT